MLENQTSKINNFIKKYQERIFAFIGKIGIGLLILFAIYRLFQWLSSLVGYSFDPYLSIILVIIFAFYIAEGNKNRQSDRDQNLIQIKILETLEKIEEKIGKFENSQKSTKNSNNFENGYLGQGVIDDQIDVDIIKQLDQNSVQIKNSKKLKATKLVSKASEIWPTISTTKYKTNNYLKK